MLSSSPFPNLAAILNPVNPLLSLSESELRDELRFALRFIGGKPASTPTTAEGLIRSKAATEWVRDFLVTLSLPRAFATEVAGKPAL